MLITAIAPVAWGSVYLVTAAFLPAGHPVWGAALRAAPAALLLVLLVRRLPRGVWWWRSAVLGLLNVAGFFILIYIAGKSLPSSVAATVMSTSAATMMLLAWMLRGQRPALLAVVGALVGVVGVAIMVGIRPHALDLWGIAASLGAMLSSSVGFVLVGRWGADVEPVPLASWQLVWGSIVLVPLAVALEGPPPALDLGAVLGFAYLSIIATGLAYYAWFTGLKRLPTGTVGLIGLLNPVTGVVLGVAFAGDVFGVAQGIGMVLVLGGMVLGIRAGRSRPDVVE